MGFPLRADGPSYSSFHFRKSIEIPKSILVANFSAFFSYWWGTLLLYAKWIRKQLTLLFPHQISLNIAALTSQEGWTAVFSSPAFKSTGWSPLDYNLFTFMVATLASQTILLSALVGSRAREISKTCQSLTSIDNKLKSILEMEAISKLVMERSSLVKRLVIVASTLYGDCEVFGCPAP